MGVWIGFRVVIFGLVLNVYSGGLYGLFRFFGIRL